ncbi:MAG: acetate/propionate family kinase [Pseudonocardiaceae bacterium]
MRLLTVNAGSSSLRIDVVELPGTGPPQPVHSQHLTEPADSATARQALDRALAEHGDGLDAIAHRLVHSGPDLRTATVVDDDVLAAADRAVSLAPQHLPAALGLVRTVRDARPRLTQVLCPDTAFHRDLPPQAGEYALPATWRRRFGLRRYGFHGLSYSWALRRTAQLLAKSPEDIEVVLAHLGGGSSVCAVRAGRSVDTTMGFTPLEGVPMSRRSGSVDPGMLLWLLTEGGLTIEELSRGLQQESGLYGLSDGHSDDTRELVVAARAGHRAAETSLAVFCHRVRGAIASMATSLTRLDAVVFTGEIGWDQAEVRTAVCAGLGLLGVPPATGANRDDDGAVSPPGASPLVLVVQPREELSLALASAAALGQATHATEGG